MQYYTAGMTGFVLFWFILYLQPIVAIEQGLYRGF